MCPARRHLGSVDVVPRVVTELFKGEIASVVWYERGHCIEVNYVDSEPDFLEGDERVVREMADDEGLLLVPTSNGVRRWVRP